MRPVPQARSSRRRSMFPVVVSSQRISSQNQTIFGKVTNTHRTKATAQLQGTSSITKTPTRGATVQAREVTLQWTLMNTRTIWRLWWEIQEDLEWTEWTRALTSTLRRLSTSSISHLPNQLTKLCWNQPIPKTQLLRAETLKAVLHQIKCRRSNWALTKTTKESLRLEVHPTRATTASVLLTICLKLISSSLIRKALPSRIWTALNSSINQNLHHRRKLTSLIQTIVRWSKDSSCSCNWMQMDQGMEQLRFRWCRRRAILRRVLTRHLMRRHRKLRHE